MLSGAAFTLKHSGSGQVLLKGKPWVNISTAAEAQAAAQRAHDLPRNHGDTGPETSASHQWMNCETWGHKRFLPPLKGEEERSGSCSVMR